MRADRAVQRARRGRGKPPGAAGQATTETQHFIPGRQRQAPETGHGGQLPERPGDSVEHALCHQVRHGRARPGIPRGGRGPLDVGPQVEYSRHQIVAADAVHHAVVHLRDERPAAALEPLQEPRFPERPGAVKPLRENPRRQLAQLASAARRWDGGMPHVIADLEVRVVGPDRAKDLQRGGPHDLAVPRHERKFRGDQPDEVLIGRSRALEHRDRADVHRDVLVLDEEESRVQRAHPLHCSASVLGREWPVPSPAVHPPVTPACAKPPARDIDGPAQPGGTFATSSQRRHRPGADRLAALADAGRRRRSCRFRRVAAG